MCGTETEVSKPSYQKSYVAPSKKGAKHEITVLRGETLTSAVKRHFVEKDGANENIAVVVDGNCVWVGKTSDLSGEGIYFHIAQTRKINQNARRVTIVEDKY